MGSRTVLVGGLVLSLVTASSQAAPGGDHQLVEAVRSGDRETVRLLLELDVDVDAPEADGATALAWAAHRNDLESAELLIHAGANVNMANKYGATPLWLACNNGSPAVVGMLLQAGSDPNATLLRAGETPLMRCARTGNVETVKLLLGHGADANARETHRGQTALMWAVAQRHPGVVRTLLEYGADVHARSKGGIPQQYGSLERTTGSTALLFAARVGDLDSARILLEAGADVNEATPEDGNALVVASASGHEEFAVFLLSKGADPNSADAYGVTALHYAVRRSIFELTGFEYSIDHLPPSNLPELVKVLLASGANPNVQITSDFPRNNRYHEGQTLSLVGATPFLLAAHAADTDLMKVLLARGANPLLAAKGGNTPLLLAAGLVRDPHLANEEENRRGLEAVKLLVELGSNINESNARGETAIHAAAFVGANAVIQYLMDKGVKVDVATRAGETPWSIAAGMCPAEGTTNACGDRAVHESAADLLLKLGASPLSSFQRD